MPNAELVDLDGSLNLANNGNFANYMYSAKSFLFITYVFSF